MKKQNTAVWLLMTLGGTCMNMVLAMGHPGKSYLNVTAMTMCKERKAGRGKAGQYGRNLKLYFDAQR